MKKIAFLSLFSLLAITACKKDSLGTKPVITFNAYSVASVLASDGMDVTFNVSDGDGDITNTFNFAAIYDTAPEDTAYDSRPMPDLEAHVGSKLTAEVTLHLYGTDFPQIGTNPVTKDSVHYLVYIQDKAGNISDTITTPKILVEYN